MKKFACLSLVILLTACGPNSSDGTQGQTTTKTTTTQTTTAPADSAPPLLPVTPPQPPSMLTQANLDRISDDMSQAEVETILGPPTSSASEPIPIVGGTQTTYTYQSGSSAVTVVFKNNQVKSKSGTFGP